MKIRQEKKKKKKKTSIQILFQIDDDSKTFKKYWMRVCMNEWHSQNEWNKNTLNIVWNEKMENIIILNY